jgi:hypothetical protein
MAKLRQLVHAMRTLARHASDTRRFKDWHTERHSRRRR